MYNMKSSTGDRMDFDSMAYNCGQDAANALELQDLLLSPSGEVEHMAESAFVAGEQFQEENRDEPGYVEDMEEAHARFVGKWADGFRTRQGELLVDETGRHADVGDGDVAVAVYDPCADAYTLRIAKGEMPAHACDQYSTPSQILDAMERLKPLDAWHENSEVEEVA